VRRDDGTGGDAGGQERGGEGGRYGDVGGGGQSKAITRIDVAVQTAGKLTYSVVGSVAFVVGNTLYRQSSATCIRSSATHCRSAQLAHTDLALLQTYR